MSLDDLIVASDPDLEHWTQRPQAIAENKGLPKTDAVDRPIAHEVVHDPVSVNRPGGEIFERLLELLRRMEIDSKESSCPLQRKGSNGDFAEAGKTEDDGIFSPHRCGRASAKTN